MHCAILQRNLAIGLKLVSHVVESRPVLPVLGNVHLEADNGRLWLTATDLRTSIRVPIGARVDEPGAITLPARTLNELVATLPDERVDLSLDDATETVTVHCATTKSTVKGISAAEFPRLPESDTGHHLELPATDFKRMLTQVLFATARQEIRPILQGVLFQLETGCLTLAAADGYRLAVRRTVTEGTLVQNAVVPSQSLTSVLRILEEDETVFITVADEQIWFQCRGVVVSSQLLEGRFPPYEGILPKTHSTTITADTDNLLKAVKRALIFAKDSGNSMKLTVGLPLNSNEAGTLHVTGRSAERGDLDGQLDVVVSGEPLTIALNGQYLIDTLSAATAERVQLDFNGDKMPILLKNEGSDEWLTVIMPMSALR